MSTTTENIDIIATEQQTIGIEINPDLIAKIKTHRSSIQTHDYDGYLGDIYHQIRQTQAPLESLNPSLSFAEAITMIEGWIVEAQTAQQRLSDLKLIAEEVFLQLPLLDLTSSEIEKLQSTHGLIRERIGVKLGNIPNLDLCRRTVHLLQTDLTGNQDQSNRIDVQELLPQVVDLILDSSEGVHQEFLLALADITEHGPCAQGRTSRLLNFYIPYKLNLAST